MKTRINTRQTNLAKVTPDKAIEDSFNTQGLISLYSFFDKPMQKAHKIDIHPKGHWVDDLTREKVSNKTYMYAVGANGALYIGNPLVHSQFKAGKDTQSAGWLSYLWNESTQQKEMTIDNCSGHYTPTLSQFLSTLYGLCQAGVLPNGFQIKLSKFTTFDYHIEEEGFFKIAKQDASDQEKTLSISVKYSAENETFFFSRESQTITLSSEQIKANDKVLSLSAGPKNP